MDGELTPPCFERKLDVKIKRFRFSLSLKFLGLKLKLKFRIWTKEPSREGRFHESVYHIFWDYGR